MLGAAEAVRRQVGLRMVIAFECARSGVHGAADRGVANRGVGEVLLGRARLQLAEAVEVAVREAPGIDLFTRDRPAQALLKQAAQAQLLAVGPGGRGASAGLLLGSVCHALVHRSLCPVAVVRPDAEAT